MILELVRDKKLVLLSDVNYTFALSEYTGLPPVFKNSRTLQDSENAFQDFVIAQECSNVKKNRVVTVLMTYIESDSIIHREWSQQVEKKLFG